MGSFVYPVLVSNLISERGVRAAMRVLGCIQLGVLIPATCLIKRFLPLDKDRKINLDTPAFKEHKFRKLFAMCGVFFMGFTVVIFFLPSYTISLGFTKAQGSLALTAKHCQTLHAHTLTALHAHTLPALPVGRTVSEFLTPKTMLKRDAAFFFSIRRGIAPVWRGLAVGPVIALEKPPPSSL